MGESLQIPTKLSEVFDSSALSICDVEDAGTSWDGERRFGLDEGAALGDERPLRAQGDGVSCRHRSVVNDRNRDALIGLFSTSSTGSPAMTSRTALSCGEGSASRSRLVARLNTVQRCFSWREAEEPHSWDDGCYEHSGGGDQRPPASETPTASCRTLQADS